MTLADDIAKALLTSNPGKRFAVYEGGKAVGHWSDEYDKWIPMYGKSVVEDQWLVLPGELLIDGKPLHDPAKWKEVK